MCVNWVIYRKHRSTNRAVIAVSSRVCSRRKVSQLFKRLYRKNGEKYLKQVEARQFKCIFQLDTQGNSDVNFQF